MKISARLKYILIQCVFLIAATGISAQTEPGLWDVPRTGGDAITEPSPEATAMRRYQDYPISYATGTADISIPLVDLQNGNLGVSLGLRYHTGGIKKTDIPTAVGLGWTLTGLGSVSRQINGFPDEWRGYGAWHKVDFDLRRTSGVDVDYLRDVLEAKKDAEYDCYNFNVAGYSGSFYIVNGIAVQYPPTELEITFTHENPDNSGEITKFQIHSPDGMIYTFEEKEYIEARSYSTHNLPPVIDRDYSAVSQWNLTKIESILDRDAITISYTPRQEWSRISDKMLSGYSFTYHVGVDLNSSYNEAGGPSLDERTTFRNHSMPSCISTSFGSIKFSSRSYSTSRYISMPADYISEITLKDAKGNVIKTVVFDNSSTFLDERQKLTGIDIFRDDRLIDRYRFSYNDRTEDRGYDFFGYPNGKGNMPGYNHSILFSNGSDVLFSPWRQTVPEFLVDNCLTEIRTITGLRTTIAYEPATIEVIPFYDESFFDGNITVGSRIKSITTTDTITGRVRERAYEYHDPVSSTPLDRVVYSDFWSQSGLHTFYGIDTKPSTYSLSVTFLPSASLRGTPVENTNLYYSKVTEKLSGTDIEHPIITDYEYDLSDVQSKLMLLGRIIPNEQYNLGNNAEDGKCLGSLQNILIGGTETDRKLIKPAPTRGYMSQTFGSGPLLKRKIEKEWTSSGYRINSTEENYYSKTATQRFKNAMYCESVVFRYNQFTGPVSTLNITDFDDVNYFYNEISAYRTVCDSIIRTTYYPDGSNRRVKTSYINSVNSGNGGKFPGFYSDYIHADAGVAFSPLGVVVSSGNESISTYTARTENVDTEVNFNISMTGLRKLPVLEKWITRTDDGSDSVIRRTTYGIFGNKSFVRPSYVWVATADGQTAISEQRYTVYDSRGRIAKMRDATGRNVEASWDDNYNLLTSMSLPDAGLLSTYTYTPLVGCTSICSPSGKKRQFTYEAGRLVSEKNTSGLQVASYSYSLYGEDDNGGQNLITSTVHDDSGDATESTLYDGFGMGVRTLSTVAGGAQTIRTTNYDALDRPIRQYLPVPGSELDETTDVSSYYSDPYPYKSVAYRNLASDNPLSVIAEGNLMQSHPTRTEYLCNSTSNATLRCHRYRLAADTDKEKISSDGYYPAGELDVVRTTDPDGHVTLLFTDWRGFKILERRVLDASTFVDTYFLYDPIGQLRVAIQPEGAAKMTATTGSWDNSSDPLSKYAFIYRYDRRGNCVHSLVPGGGAVEMRYDGYNRLAFRSTAAMAADGQTEFSLYDCIGRVVVNGIADIDINDIELIYDMTAAYSASAEGLDGTGYEITSPELRDIVGDALVTIANYYDNYRVAGRDGFVSLRDCMSSPLPLQGSSGLLTATRQAVFSPTYGDAGAEREYQYSIFAYDNEERQIETASSTIIENGMDFTTTQYSRLGHVNRATETVRINDTTHNLYLTNTHDALGNITKAEASLDRNEFQYSVPGKSKIEYTYDVLGRMNRMALHSAAGRYCDYSYNLRGQLRSIASPVFAQRLYYEDGDSPCYNGSLSSEQYGYECDVASGEVWLTEGVTYSYDALNRLIASVSTDGYDTSYTYDLNSAPTAIVRKGLLSDGVSIGVVDDLTLGYSGNRLNKIYEAVSPVNLEASLDFTLEPSPGIWDQAYNSYRYDASGRLTGFPGSGYSTIKYAPNDMPVSVGSDQSKVTYRYRADGKKLSTSVPRYLSALKAIRPIGTTTRYDIGAFRFISNGDVQPLQIERVNLPWGYLDKSLKANINVKDYQGNIRAVFNQCDLTVTQQTDYYPYGLPKATSTAPAANPYKYGGKELNTDTPLSYYDFEARMQLPAFGLFQRPDPQASTFPWLNTYTYCGGDPVNRADPTGMFYETPIDISFVLYDGIAALYNYAIGDYDAAKEHLVDLTVDVVATFTPFLPAGVSKLARGTDKAIDVAKGVDHAADAAKAADHATDAAKAVDHATDANKGLKNADKIAEGKAFEQEQLQLSLDNGLDVVSQRTLVPLNGKGNVKGNITKPDQLIRNSDGTYSIIETKRSETTHLTKGQRAAKEHIEQGDGYFEVRSKIDEFDLMPGNRIRVVKFNRNNKYPKK